MWHLDGGLPTIGTLLIFANLTNYLVRPVMNLVQTVADVASARAGFERIDRFMALPEARTPGFAESEGEEAAAMRAVGYRYPGQSGWAVRGLSAVLRRGETTLLWGRSGCGKSTLLKLLYGLIPQPEEGVIARDRRLTWGYFPQSPVLLNLTVEENFRMARPDIAEDDIWALLALTDMAETLRGKAEGLGLALNHMENGFSGGQYRRLCLSVFLAQEKDVLLFDEPTASLDQQSAGQIAAALKSLQLRGKTLIVASHDAQLRTLGWREIVLPTETDGGHPAGE